MQLTAPTLHPANSLTLDKAARSVAADRYALCMINQMITGNMVKIILISCVFFLLGENAIAQSVHEDSVKIIFKTVTQKIEDSLHIRIIKTDYINIFEFQVDSSKLEQIQEKIKEALRLSYEKENIISEEKRFDQINVIEMKKELLKSN